MDLLLLQLIMPLLFIVPLLFIMPLWSTKLQLFPIRVSMELLTMLLTMGILVIQQFKMFISQNLLDNLIF